MGHYVETPPRLIVANTYTTFVNEGLMANSNSPNSRKDIQLARRNILPNVTLREEASKFAILLFLLQLTMRKTKGIKLLVGSN
jgi:hypothetical protein